MKEEKKEGKKNSIIRALCFYKNNMLKRQIVVFILSLVIFGIMFTFCLNQLDPNTFLKQVASVAGYQVILAEFGIFVLLALVLGMIPYLYASVISLLYASRLASYLTNLLYARNEKNVIMVTMIAVLLLLVLSFAITTGMQMCRYITQKITKRGLPKKATKQTQKGGNTHES